MRREKRIRKGMRRDWEERSNIRGRKREDERKGARS